MDFTKDANYLPHFKSQDPVYSYSLHEGFIHFQKKHPIPTFMYDDNHWTPGGHYLAALFTYNYLVSNRLIPLPEGKIAPNKMVNSQILNIMKKANSNNIKTTNTKGYLDLLNAIVEKNLGHPKKAIDGYKKFLKENNDELEIHLQLAKAYNSINNIGGIFKHLEIAAKGKSKTRSNEAYKKIYAFFKMKLELVTHMKNKNFKKAISVFENYKFPIKKDKHKFYYWIGLSCLSLNNVLKAEFYFQKAIEDKPDNYLYHLILGEIYYQSKKYQKAIMSLNNSLSLKENLPKAYSLSALSYLELGNKSLAISTFKKILKLDPNNITALNHIKQLSE
jgi:tetratricopeptide (TPR) repeat protein